MRPLLPKRISEAPERTRKDVNVVLMSVSIFMVFGAFFTMGNIQSVIIENAQDTDSAGYVEDFNGDGFLSLSIVYWTSCAFDFLSPSIVAWLGLRWAMMLAGTMYALFVSTFFVLKSELLYTGSVLLGIGNALLWIAQGAFLALNSEPDTIARNSGCFYAFLMTAGLLGNTFTYFQFKDSYEIHPDEREVFLAVLLIITCVGICVNLLYLPMPWVNEKSNEKPDTPWTGFVRALQLFSTPNMVRLVPYFCYIGFWFTFWQGVYGPSLTFARSFGDDEAGNSLTGLHGIAVHGGMIVSSSIFTIFFRHRVRSIGHWPFVVIAISMHFVSYVLVLVNVPPEAPMGVTYGDALLVVPSSKALAITASLLLGLGGGLMDTQTLTFLGSAYSHRASQAFAVYKICQHASSGVSFAYSGYINIYWQLGVLTALGAAGMAGFTWVDLINRAKARKDAREEEGKKLAASSTSSSSVQLSTNSQKN